METLTILLKKYYKIILLIAVLALIFLTPIRSYLDIEQLSDWLFSIKEQPFSGVIYGAIYVAGVILFIPGLALTTLAGVLFGFVKGSLIVVVASNIGVQIAFLISRYIGRGFVEKFIKEDSFVDKMSTKMEKNGFMVMLYLRLLPVFPFNVINYASGLTPVKYRDYALASVIGMLPGTLVYVYLAASAANIKNNPWGLAISIAVLILFTLGMKLLNKKKGDSL